VVLPDSAHLLGKRLGRVTLPGLCLARCQAPKPQPSLIISCSISFHGAPRFGAIS
jgi:hypothetical protein